MKTWLSSKFPNVLALLAHPQEAAEAFRERSELWRDTSPRLWAEPIQVSEEPVFFQTGDELIGRILRSIQLNQSVVLSGPRGCGKSRCIIEAIKRAEKEGIIPPTGWIKVQGNKEIPRDYLAEDGITFRFSHEMDAVTGKSRQIINPAKQGAPFFRFAKRHPESEEPLRDGATGRVECEIRRDEDPPGIKRPLLRFVVFLDEINRFSDGVLDSLLSVLEERTVILNAVEYKLPVVVCMTMNPPGYDATARKLSPPLAARIGRSYRLYTPDLDVLSDVIMEPKLQDQAENRLTAARTNLSTLSNLLNEMSHLVSSAPSGWLQQSRKQKCEELARLHLSVSQNTSVLQQRERSERAAVRRFDEASRNKVRETVRDIRTAHVLISAEGFSLPLGDAETKAINCLDRIRESLEQLEQVIELEELFPVISPKLIRKVALITLCLWGTVPEESQTAGSPRWPWQLQPRKSTSRAGLEYLTINTLNLLRAAMASSDGLRRDMNALGELCHFGPDGRAGSDWLLTAIGVAIERGRISQLAHSASQPTLRFERVELTPEYLVETAVECVAHKIYDKFSAASQPALTARKEQAVLDIARRVLYGHSGQSFDKLVERKVDNLDSLWKAFGGANPTAPADKAAFDHDKHLLREQFIKAGVTQDGDVDLWCKRIDAWWAYAKGQFSPPNKDRNAQKLLAILQEDKDGVGLLLISANKERGLAAGFSEERHRRLAERLKRFQPQQAPPLPISEFLGHQSVWPEIGGPPRSTVPQDLQDQYEAVRRIGLKTFTTLCTAHQLRDVDAEWLADASQQLWDQNITPGQPDQAARSAIDSFRPAFQTNRRKALVGLLPFLESAVLAYHGREGEQRLRFLWRCRTSLEENSWRDLGKQYEATARLEDDSFVRVSRRLRLSESDAEGVAIQLQDLWRHNLNQGTPEENAQQALQHFGVAQGNLRMAMFRLLDPLILASRKAEGKEGPRTQFLRAVKVLLKR